MEDLIRCPKYNCQQSESNLNIAVLYTSAMVRICHPILSLYHKETFGHMMPQERSAQSSEYITKDTIWLLKERTTIHPTTLRTSHCTLHHSLRATAWLNEREHLFSTGQHIQQADEATMPTLPDPSSATRRKV